MRIDRNQYRIFVFSTKFLFTRIIILMLILISKTKISIDYYSNEKLSSQHKHFTNNFPVYEAIYSYFLICIYK